MSHVGGYLYSEPTCGYRDCYYMKAMSNQLFCDYLKMEHHKRPCAPTPECICYKPDKKRGKLGNKKGRYTDDWGF